MRDFPRLVEIAKSMRVTCQTGKFFHVSYILKGGKIIVTGFNDYNKKNPVSATYKPTRITNSINYFAGIHSENKVLAKIRFRTDISDLMLVNVRINNNGELDLSCPCPNCAYQIGLFGLKKVYFSTKSGFERLKP